MNEELVTYTLIVNQQLIVVEHVPARVDPQTGERFFRPDVVEQLQQLVWQSAFTVPNYSNTDVWIRRNGTCSRLERK